MYSVLVWLPLLVSGVGVCGGVGDDVAISEGVGVGVALSRCCC